MKSYKSLIYYDKSVPFSKSNMIDAAVRSDVTRRQIGHKEEKEDPRSTEILPQIQVQTP